MSAFTGKVAVVTGGGSGVGLSAAKKLAALGAHVVIAGRDAAKLASAVDEIGHGAKAVPTDIADAGQCLALLREAEAAFGRVDILVNCAGFNIKARTFRELTPESWDRMMRANLDGAFYCTHAALPGMLARKDGVIVNVVSVAGKRGNPLGGAAYVAAKFGLGGMATALANEEKDSGVRVSNIYPGEIDTPILDQRPTAVTDAHRATILLPDDVADAIVYVAGLPPRVSVPELIIKPTTQQYF